MRVLNLDYIQCQFRSLVEMAVSGHEVFDTFKYLSNSENLVHLTEVFGVQNIRRIANLNERISVPDIITTIKNLDIECLIVSNPSYSLMHKEFSDKLHYIGPSYDAVQTEIRRFETKKEIESLGIKVPNLIDNSEKETFPRVIKSRDTHNPSKFVETKEQLESLDLSYEYYTEEAIDRKYEIEVFYTIFDHQYFLRSMHSVYGEEKNKTVGQASNLWFKGVTFETVSPEVEKLILPEFEKFVNWVKNFDGKYEARVTFIVDQNDDVYFIETNARNGWFNSNPIIMPGYDWLTGMTTDFSVYAKPEYENVKLNKISVEETTSRIYPLFLHDEYSIDIPANLFFDRESKECIMNHGLVVSSTKDLSEFSGDLIERGLKVNL